MQTTESIKAEVWEPAQRTSRWADLLRSIISPLLIFTSVSVFLASTLNIWTDEAFTLETTARGPGFALQQALGFELQAPLYFVLLSMWRMIDGSIFFARLFSVICASCAVFTLTRVAGRLFKDLNPGWVALLFAVNPYMFWAATEIRLYAFALLLTSLLILFFLRGYVADNPGRWDRPAFLLIATLSLYTQYYLGFLLVAHALCLVLLKRWRTLGAYLIGMLVVALAFCPMLTYIRAQFATHTGANSEITGYFRALDLTAWRSKDLVIPAEQLWAIELRKWLIRAGYLSMLVVALRSRHKLFSETNKLVWGLFTGSAFLFSIAITLTSEGMLLPRHMVALFPLAVLFVVSLLSLAKHRSLRVSIFLLLIAFSVLSTWTRFRSLSKEGNWKEVAAYLQNNEKPGEPILLFHGGAALPLKYHYIGGNRLLPLPDENRFDTFDIRRYVLQSEEQIGDRIIRSSSSDGTYWLVSDNVCGYLGVDYNCDLLDRYVKEHFDILDTSNFGRTTVKKLSMRKDTVR